MYIVNHTSMSDKQTDRFFRQSNIELLRIIAMLIIIAHHFAGHSEFEFSTNIISVNRLWIQFIHIGGKIGLNLFVLISGYFLISKQSIKTDKIIKLWGEIFFYSITIFLFFVFFGLEPFSTRELIKHIAPVTFSQWWFASAYFVLYLLAPFLNRLLRSFDKKQYIYFLALLLLLWSVIPTFTGQTFQSNYLLWFMVLYSVAGYIKIYGLSTKVTSVKLIMLSLVFTILTYLSVVLFDFMGTKISFFGTHATFFYNMQRLPVFVISVLLFSGFSQLDMGYSKLINTISSATFGVYLIHDNGYVRPFLWKTVFQNASYSDSKLLIPYSLIIIAVVFLGCSMIELIRIVLIEKSALRVINKVSMFIDCKIKTSISKKVSDRLRK